MINNQSGQQMADLHPRQIPGRVILQDIRVVERLTHSTSAVEYRVIAFLLIETQLSSTPVTVAMPLYTGTSQQEARGIVNGLKDKLRQ